MAALAIKCFFSLQEIKKQLFIDIFGLHLTARAVITEFMINLCRTSYIQNSTNVCCTHFILIVMIGRS